MSNDQVSNEGECPVVGLSAVPARVGGEDRPAPTEGVPEVQAVRLAGSEPEADAYNVKPGLPDNPKVAHLADRLDIEEAHALGILVRLWDRVSSTCETGILSGWTARDFARQVGWRGSATDLLDALRDERWLDRSAHDPALHCIHDWPEEAPRHVAARWARSMGLGRDGEREARDRMRVLHDEAIGVGASDDRAVDAQRTRGARSPHTSVLYGSDRGCTERSGAVDLSSDADAPSAPNAKPSKAKAPKSRKPVTEQQGLVGDLARAWSAAYATDDAPAPVPTWGGEVVRASKLASGRGAEEVLKRWGHYLACADPFFQGHPLTKFTSAACFDRFMTPCRGRCCAKSPQRPAAPARRVDPTAEVF